MGSRRNETEGRDPGTDMAEMVDLVMGRLKRVFSIFSAKQGARSSAKREDRDDGLRRAEKRHSHVGELGRE